LVGWVTANRQARVARDVAGDPFHFKNPLLPETRSEATVPLLAGGKLLGAMNVQSKNVDAFNESDMQVLQTLADQLSIAIDNAALFQRTESNLQEMQSLYQQVAGGSWRALLGQQQRETTYDLQPGTELADHTTPIVVPLRVRNQIVGTIEFSGRAEKLQPEEQAAIDTVSAQLAAALESAALFQETQRRSRREQLVNEITEQMRASLNPASILQNGIRELGRALGATEVAVRLRQQETTSPTGEEVTL
jgi:GAF domain-containing protein